MRSNKDKLTTDPPLKSDSNAGGAAEAQNKGSGQNPDEVKPKAAFGETVLTEAEDAPPKEEDAPPKEEAATTESVEASETKEPSPKKKYGENKYGENKYGEKDPEAPKNRPAVDLRADPGAALTANAGQKRKPPKPPGIKRGLKKTFLSGPEQASRAGPEENGTAAPDLSGEIKQPQTRKRRFGGKKNAKPGEEPPKKTKPGHRLKRNRSGAQKPKNPRGVNRKQKGPGLWGWLKRCYLFIAGSVFFLACCFIAFVTAKPWFDLWLVNAPPAITLPSQENLRLMPRAERLQLRDSAIRMAPFRRKRIAADPIPFEGGRPNEIRLYRIKAVGKNVKVIGKLRLYEMPDKRQFMRLTDFEITAGYDLRILLAAHTNPRTESDLKDGGYVDLAPLKGETGSQNYLLPKALELSDFGSFLIYDQLFEIIYAVSKL